MSHVCSEEAQTMDQEAMKMVRSLTESASAMQQHLYSLSLSDGLSHGAPVQALEVLRAVKQGVRSWGAPGVRCAPALVEPALLTVLIPYMHAPTARQLPSLSGIPPCIQACMVYPAWFAHGLPGPLILHPVQVMPHQQELHPQHQHQPQTSALHHQHRLQTSASHHRS